MQARGASEKEKIKVDFLFQPGSFCFVNGKGHKNGPQHPSEKQECFGGRFLNKLKIEIVEA